MPTGRDIAGDFIAGHAATPMKARALKSMTAMMITALPTETGFMRAP